MNVRCGWIVLAGLLLAACPQTPKSPVGWRNDGTGRHPGAAPPLEWSSTKNILWETKIGPNKYSSPVVVDGKIFLVADPALLFCVNAEDGRVLWKKSNDFADLPDPVVDPKRKLGDAGNTTPTPVSDGRSVYVVFGTGIVAAYDLNGDRRWIRHFDLKPAQEYGRAASPVLAGGRLLVQLSCLIALDPDTGKELWRNKEVPELYGTPVAATIGGVEVVVTPSGQVVRVSDGTVLVGDLGGLNFASPIVGDGTVYMIQAGAIAQKLAPSAAGAWQAKAAWEQDLEGTFYASALIDGDLIYAVSSLNLFFILDAKDGKLLVSQDLTPPGAAPGARPNLYPSIALAGGRLYVLNDLGEAVVLEPGRTYRELKRNRLGDGHGGAPAFDGKRLFLRSGQTLYCIAEK
jgi:outer membrane protein assembly factor BamB